MTTMLHSDITIIGAGPAGLSMACALAESGLSIAIVDLQSEDELADPKMDGREIALNHMSKTILNEWGVWDFFDQKQIHPLQDAKVLNGDSSLSNNHAIHFQRTDKAGVENGEPLGLLIANYHIRKALYQRVKQLNNVTFVTGKKVQNSHTTPDSAFVTLEDGSELTSQLLIGADNRFSNVRKMMGIGAKMKDYGRIMIVTNMRHTLPHHSTAVENFKYGKTCAILPLDDKRCSIVITVNADLAEKYKALNDAAFAEMAEALVEGELGKMTVDAPSVSYPLIGVYSDRFTKQRCALIGDAAVGMHPVTAHGFNLGVRSADTLAAQIIKAMQSGKDIGSQSVLHGYEMRHQVLAKPMYEGTNAVVKLFTNDSPAAKIARKIAIKMSNNLPGIKQLINHRLTQVR